jgi:hypothetical protein
MLVEGSERVQSRSFLFYNRNHNPEAHYGKPLQRSLEWEQKTSLRIAQNFSLLRPMALQLLKKEPTPRFRRKPKRAAMGHAVAPDLLREDEFYDDMQGPPLEGTDQSSTQRPTLCLSKFRNRLSWAFCHKIHSLLAL